MHQVEICELNVNRKRKVRNRKRRKGRSTERRKRRWKGRREGRKAGQKEKRDEEGEEDEENTFFQHCSYNMQLYLLVVYNRSGST